MFYTLPILHLNLFFLSSVTFSFIPSLLKTIFDQRWAVQKLIVSSVSFCCASSFHPMEQMNERGDIREMLVTVNWYTNKIKKFRNAFWTLMRHIALSKSDMPDYSYKIKQLDSMQLSPRSHDPDNFSWHHLTLLNIYLFHNDPSQRTMGSNIVDTCSISHSYLPFPQLCWHLLTVVKTCCCHKARQLQRHTGNRCML